MSNEKSRRRYMATVGALLTSGLAGCSGSTDDGGDGGGSDGGDGGGGDGETPASTPTEASGGEATEEPTAEPTETPTEEPTPSPTEAGLTAGESYSFEGEGTSTTDELSFRGGVVTVDYSHDGERNFIVEAVAVEGDSLDDQVLANAIGTVEGGTASRIGEGAYHLNIDADGSWSLAVNEPGSSGAEELPFETSGSGPQYAGPVTIDGVANAQGSHSGSRNFIVEMLRVDGGQLDDAILFNEVGEFEGSTSERLSGTYFVSVEADGDWSLTFE